MKCTRSIVFIAHSLGGLILKKSLCLSASSVEDHLRQIDQCTKAIAFLGTPHRGSNLASFSTSIGNLLKVSRKRVNVDILRILKANDEIPLDVEDSFAMWLRTKNGINITCFGEELELPLVGQVR